MPAITPAILLIWQCTIVHVILLSGMGAIKGGGHVPKTGVKSRGGGHWAKNGEICPFLSL